MHNHLPARGNAFRAAAEASLAWIERRVGRALTPRESTHLKRLLKGVIEL